MLAQYFAAVQAGDVEDIAAALADCLDREDCETEIVSAQASVSAQRELDAYRFDDPWGFGLVQAFVLGAGGFWRVDEVLADETSGELEVRMTVKTQYTAEETRGLPRGAVIEYLVAPLGTVKRLERGQRGPGALRQQLVELQLRATLVPREGGWFLRRLDALPETAVFESVSWWPQ